jgi:uncharacterized membrane protein YgcG
MKCPSCASRLAAAEPRCPTCKLTLQALDIKFGAVPRHSMYFTDRTDRVPLREMAAVRQTVELFHRRFPQCLFSVFVADLPRDTPVAEYAFWLANRARFSSVEQVHGENFDLLLVIDLSGRNAALNAGYGLEEHLREEDLEAALAAFTSRMRGDDLPGAVQACVDAVADRLSQRWMLLNEQRRDGETADECAPQETWA